MARLYDVTRPLAIDIRYGDSACIGNADVNAEVNAEVNKALEP